MGKIWVKLFKSNNKHYCYDVTTNHIMRIDEVLYDLLAEYNFSNKLPVFKKLIKKHPENLISQAISVADQFNQDKGGFGFKKKMTLRFPFSKDQYRHALENCVNHVVLNLTENCNFRCRYCKYSGSYPNSRPHSAKSMKWNTIQAAIDFLVEHSSYIIEKSKKDLVVGFYGGEPLLEKHKIRQAVDYIKNKYHKIFSRFRFSMTTNGSLLDEKMIHFFADHNFALLISLDGPKLLHDRYRISSDGNGSYDKIIANIDLIRKIAPEYFKNKVGFSTVIAPEFHLKDVVDYFSTHFDGDNRVCLFSMVDEKETNFFTPFDMKTEWNHLRREEERLKEEYKQVIVAGNEDNILSSLFGDNIHDIHKRQLRPISDSAFPNGICLPGLQKLFIDTDGYLHFCEKINWEFNIGHIDSGFEVDKIFSYVAQYIESTNHCKHCWAIRFCKECFLSSIDNNTFSREKKKANCRIERKRLLKSMKHYVEVLEENKDALQQESKEENREISEFVFEMLKNN